MQERWITISLSVFFPPCVNGTSNIVLPSRQDCYKVQTDTCKLEWTLLSKVSDFSSSLPDCNCLPLKYISESSEEDIHVLTNESVGEFQCDSLFTQVDCFCLPSCSTFRVNTESGQRTEDFFIYLTIITGLLTASIYFALVCKRRKKL